jgi:hypothetical protein
MSPFIVLLPHIVAILSTLAFAAVMLFLWFILAGIVVIWLFRYRSPDGRLWPQRVAGLSEEQWRHVLCWPTLALLFVLCVAAGLRLSPLWLRAGPTPGWQARLAEVDTAIVFGFGIESEGDGRAGAANRFLADWTLERSRATTLIVQEGVLIAAGKGGRQYGAPGRTVLRMHRHNAEYVDTLDAAACALEQMERLGRRRALVVAHDLQLARAVADLHRVAQTNPRWRDMEFVVPAVPPTPFPAGSVHWHTRGFYRYATVELFVSRPRDVFRTVPQACVAPAGDAVGR